MFQVGPGRRIFQTFSTLEWTKRLGTPCSWLWKCFRGRFFFEVSEKVWTSPENIFSFCVRRNRAEIKKKPSDLCCNPGKDGGRSQPQTIPLFGSWEHSGAGAHISPAHVGIEEKKRSETSNIEEEKKEFVYCKQCFAIFNASNLKTSTIEKIK